MVTTRKHGKEVSSGLRKGGKKAPVAFSNSSLEERQRKPKKSQQLEAKKSEALRAALANAFSTSVSHSDDTNTGNSTLSVDEYGKGSPTDRLQFGYAPMNAAEAVAFHSDTSAKKWVAERRRNFLTTIIKRQKLSRPNCEPLTSVIKLKDHWRNTAKFVAEVRGGGGVAQESVDDLLDMLVSQQRVV